MKRFFTLFFLFFAIFSFGQNLIPDPSAEDYLDCPSSLGFPELWLVNWETYRGSPDYFNVCNAPLGANNSVGFQNPRSGDGYLGGVSHSTAFLTREYFGINLTEPLLIGSTYYVSFYTSLAHRVSAGIRTASNNIGALFMTDNYLASNESGVVPNWCHINFETIINDTTNWTLVSGTLLADSAYIKVLFGNFFDDDNTLFEYPFEIDNVGQAYYYFDDFCVTLNPDGCEDFLSSLDQKADNHLTIWPNPAQYELHYSIDIGFSEIRIIDMLGKLVYVEKKGSQNSGTIQLNLKKGIYLIVFLERGKRVSGRFMVQ